MSETMTPPPVKKVKKQGPIRWNAIIPFAILVVLTYLYFTLFFDLHMKKAIEWTGYQALGAEVNVGQFKSSFIKGHVQISKLELTNKDKPDYNSIEFGDIRFDLNWDALLRVKFVIEEIAVEGIQLMSKRAHRGKVAPPKPPSNEPSFVDQLQNKALNKLDKDNPNNILGDVAQFLQSGNFDAQIQNLESQLASKRLIEEMNQKWTTKRTEWDAQIKTLPTSEDLKNLNTRFNSIKYKDFQNLQELDASIKEADALVKEIDARSKQVQELKNNFETDLKSLDQDRRAIELQVKTDIDTLKSHFKIPKIDASSFAKALFMSYLTPYMRKLDEYKAMLQKYLPPKYAKMIDGEKTQTVDDTIQPHPRTNGVTYEFPIQNGYPLFWIQAVRISSQSNAQADYGDFKGLISHITSNQRQIGKPTTLKIDGDYKSLSLKGIHINALFNNINPDVLVKFDLGVDSYPIKDIRLIQSKEADIAIPLSDSKFFTSGEILGFKNYDLRLSNAFRQVSFDISAENKIVAEVLKGTLGTINQFDLQASAKGELKNLDIDIRSSLGGDLERAFQNLLQNKIKEANEQLQKTVNAEIDKLKAQFNAQVDALKQQAEGEIKKVQTQLDAQKKQTEDKIAQAKKDFEDQVNKAKKEAEDKAKSELQKEGQKQLDGLKKKFGL